MYKKYARQMLKNTYFYFLKILTYHCGLRVPGSLWFTGPAGSLWFTGPRLSTKYL